MKRLLMMAAWVGVMAVHAQAPAGELDTLMFRHEFDTSGPGGLPDPAVWIVNHPESWWWVQGRTFFPSPLYHPEGPFPRVVDGKCIISHHRYDPYDAAHWTFLGGEIRTVLEFDPARAYLFEARVRCGVYPNGLVTSFFTYGYDGAESDEIDFEFVSNRTNDDASYPDADPVLTNTWNESRQRPAYAAPAGLDLTEWNTFRIRWLPGPRRVEWAWADGDSGEVVLRTETEALWVPDEPMGLYFNFWAPTEAWADAYDAGLQPADDARWDELYEYEIDSVRVLIDSPLPGDVNLDCVVDLADIVAAIEHWQATGEQATWPNGDVNRDGGVDLADVVEMIAHWQQQCPAAGPPAAHGRATAPEPPALLVLCPAAAALLRRRR